MTELHLLLAEVALALVALAAIWSAAAVILRRDPGRLYLVNLIWVVIVLVAAAGFGALMLATGRGPRDGLHVLYGVLAVAALPVAAAVAGDRPARDRAVVGLIAVIVLIILVLRLFQTAG